MRPNKIDEQGSRKWDIIAERLPVHPSRHRNQDRSLCLSPSPKAPRRRISIREYAEKLVACCECEHPKVLSVIESTLLV